MALTLAQCVSGKHHFSSRINQLNGNRCIRNSRSKCVSVKCCQKCRCGTLKRVNFMAYADKCKLEALQKGSAYVPSPSLNSEVSICVCLMPQAIGLGLVSGKWPRYALYHLPQKLPVSWVSVPILSTAVSLLPVPSLSANVCLLPKECRCEAVIPNAITNTNKCSLALLQLRCHFYGPARDTSHFPV